MLLTHGALAVLRAASVSRQAGKTLDGLRSRGLAVQARASYNKAARDVARAIATTDAYTQSRKDRKKVEMLFAHLRRILKLDKLRLRGLPVTRYRAISSAYVPLLHACSSGRRSRLACPCACRRHDCVFALATRPLALTAGPRQAIFAPQPGVDVQRALQPVRASPVGGRSAPAGRLGVVRQEPAGRPWVVPSAWRVR